MSKTQTVAQSVADLRADLDALEAERQRLADDLSQAEAGALVAEVLSVPRSVET